MPVTGVQKDAHSLTMTITAEFDATPERVWRLWADPRQLERWWGPPTYPATVTAYDLRPGGHVLYHMTGPAGDQSHGYWQVLDVSPPGSLSLLNGLADEHGRPDPDVPAGMLKLTIRAIDGGRTQMSIENRFPSIEVMERMLEMGMEEGMRQAVGQIDAILAER
jgi:uncharacterized protein YndB with AHSA1/START domain